MNDASHAGRWSFIRHSGADGNIDAISNTHDNATGMEDLSLSGELAAAGSGGDDMNKEWEARLVYLSPGSRRRVKIVAQNLAALVPWKLAGKPSPGRRGPAAPKGTARYSTASSMTGPRTAFAAVPNRGFRLIRNPLAGPLAKERGLTRAALKLVKSDR